MTSCLSMRIWIVVAGMAAAPFRAGAETPPRLRLEDCLRLGLERSVPVLNARREAEGAEAQIGQIRARILPELRARGEYRRDDEVPQRDFGIGPQPLGRQNNYSASLELGQLLYDGGSVQAALRAAYAYRARARAGVRRAEADRTLAIREAFHATLFAREAVAVEEHRVAQLERFVQEAEVRFRQDAASEFDLLSARVRLANAHPALIAARRDFQLARAALRSLVLIEMSDFEIAGELEFDPRLPDLAVAVAQALDQRPELEQVRHAVTLAEAELRVEQGAYGPTIRARAGYAGQNPPGFGAASDEWEWQWNLGLTAEWAILEGGLRRNRVREKRIARAVAAALVEDAERGVALEVEQAYYALWHAIEAARAARETVALADRAVEIARTRYAAGLSTALELAESGVAAAEARLNWFGALRAQGDARARLEWACGGPIDHRSGAPGVVQP